MEGNLPGSKHEPFLSRHCHDARSQHQDVAVSYSAYQEVSFVAQHASQLISGHSYTSQKGKISSTGSEIHVHTIVGVDAPITSII